MLIKIGTHCYKDATYCGNTKKQLLLLHLGIMEKANCCIFFHKKKTKCLLAKQNENTYIIQKYIHIYIYAHTHKPTNNFKYNCSRTVSQKTDLNLPKCFFSYTITFSRVLAKIQYNFLLYIETNIHIYCFHCKHTKKGNIFLHSCYFFCSIFVH